jgi:DNA helicase-4
MNLIDFVAETNYMTSRNKPLTSKSYIKYTNSFGRIEEIRSSENLEAVKDEEKKNFVARVKKRRQDAAIERERLFFMMEKKEKKARQDRYQEKINRVERAAAQAEKERAEKREALDKERRQYAAMQKEYEKKQPERDAADRMRKIYEQAKRDLEDRKRRIYKQQHTTTMAVLEDDFVNAERIIEGINKDWLVNFEAIKAEWVRKWVSSKHLSENQLAAIGDVSQNCLLRARAGSGKTTVLKQKIDLLLRKTKIQPDEIMALAFNGPAAAEIKRKVQSDFNHLTFSNSRTFHSLAYRIVNPVQKVLKDKEQSQYIESLLKDEMNPAVIQDIYEFFRMEMAEIQNLGSLLNEHDFYHMRRNSTHQTLKDEQVKSTGEKWIADFLFEHDLRYAYERSWSIDAKNKAGNYHPDFSIAVQRNGTDVVLEHWGIDEFDSKRLVPEHWTKSWDQYRSEMDWKRNYWREHNSLYPKKPIVFIETSIRDMRGGREKFENILKQKLIDIKVLVMKLPLETLQNEIVRTQTPKLVNSIRTFIQRAKKACLSPRAVDQKLIGFKFESKKEEVFVKLATRMYHRYQESLLGRLDFDDLLREATGKIHQQKGMISIETDDHSSIALDKIKWIMIDEYQDFSQLFFNLLDSLRTYNPEVKFFCVGDNWQAINGFAGSDLKFFDDFESYFKSATILDLPDNYRSQSNIVDQANSFMRHKTGEASIAKNGGLTWNPIIKYHANDVYINFDNHDPHKEHEIYKTREISKGELKNIDPTFKMARLFRLCQKIIKQYSLKDTTFMILRRGKYLAYRYSDLELFKAKLKKVFDESDISQFRDFDDQVRCVTAHRSKGDEADVVIVLNVDERKFPQFHPDNLLYRILGVTVGDVYEEEERLFYVAITRAKKELYLVTEKNRESEFLFRIDSTLEDMETDHSLGY